MSVVLDASVLIAYLQNDDAHFGPAVRLLKDAAEQGDSLAISTVTLSEVLVGPVRRRTEPLALEVIDDLAIAEVPFPPGAALALARLRADTGLKLPDCCVLLTALDRGAALASFDGRLLDKAAELGVPVRDSR